MNVTLLSRIVIAVTLLATPYSYSTTVNSKDAYVRIDDQAATITIGTSSVEQRMQLAHGEYLLQSLRNRTTHTEYVAHGSTSDEFKVTVNGDTITGASGDWTWKSASATVLPQGKLECTVTLQGNLLEVEKHYLLYPNSSIIRQWVVFKNRSGRDIKLSNPYMLTGRLLADAASSQTLSYITGGGSFTGSQILKQVPLTSAYSRTFDTTDKAEIQKVQGIVYDNSMPYASGRYMPWFGISGNDKKEGLFVGFDYYGHWVAEVGNFQDAAGYVGIRLAGYEKQLKPNDSVESPKAFTGIYVGDLDAMGNELKAWQYRYLWDHTKDDYFTRIRVSAELREQSGKGGAGGSGTQDNWDFRLMAVMHTMDVIRYLGADILWHDVGWHDYIGDNDGPDFTQVNQYLTKSGVRLALWWPLWFAEKQSQVARDHPDWGTGTIFGDTPLDTSRPEIIQWMISQLDQKVKAWGDFQWREDGSSIHPVGGNQTPMLAQYNNMMEMQKEFLRQHPGSSIDLCGEGGNLMSYEGLRLADVAQLTDGGAITYGNYYSSYLFPPDKIDDWTRTYSATPADVATTLTMAPAWMNDRGIFGHEPGLSLGEENVRKTFEIYHYLVREGVAGRWVQIYHPKIEGDDPIYYLQRLSKDGHRGVIVLKHFISGEIRIYPKGLHPKEIYDLRFRMSKAIAKRTGEDLVQNGITLVNAQDGELIYLGLPNHPGSGNDSTPPTAPSNVKKHLGTNIGITGVELEWTASTDNNWISYYQIYRDGEPIDKVSKGLYYFDHSSRANLGSTYQVQAVDGDGNVSAKVDSTTNATGNAIYTALGGYLTGKDYSYQGANGWSYEEWNGAKKSRAVWNGALGQMGLYQGASEKQLLIGASWMKPGSLADAVKVFTIPTSGRIAISGSVHKDIYHTYGDGVRVMILKGDQQIWPDTGWQTIAATDTKGKGVDLMLDVNAGERLYFIVNRNSDDDTVWNPQIRYLTEVALETPKQQTRLDDVDHAIKYSGEGWQVPGTPPWAKSANGIDMGGDMGYLTDRFRGTLTVSGNSGDRMKLSFRGTAIQIIGDVGSDRGIAQVTLDGEDKGTIDSFVPENLPNETAASRGLVYHANNVAYKPAIALWGITGLSEKEHTLELTVTGRKNIESSGTFIGIDEVVIDGTAIDDLSKP